MIRLWWRVPFCMQWCGAGGQNHGEGCLLPTGEEGGLCCGDEAGQPDICGRVTCTEQAPVNYGQSTASTAQHHLQTEEHRLRRLFLLHVMGRFNTRGAGRLHTCTFYTFCIALGFSVVFSYCWKLNFLWG